MSQTQAPAFNASAVSTAAQTLATADKAFSSAITTVAEQVARILTDKPTYTLWEQVASAFCADYAKARGCEVKTAENRWSFVAAELRSRFALEKPKKPTEAAQKKAQQRAGQAAKVDELVKAHGSVQALMEAAKKAQPADLPTFARAIEKASASAAVDAKKAAKEAEKRMRDEARTIIAHLDGKALEKAVTQLRKLVPADKLAEIVKASA
jgi:hypothetical protein